jgi:hypothetical protein
MPANYVLLERIELNASAASITFSNIPQSGYTDLKLIVSARQDNGDNNLIFKPNNATTSISTRMLTGDGSSASSNTSTTPYGLVGQTGFTSNTFGNTEWYIPNYTSANFKSWSVDECNENNGTTAYSRLQAGLWSSTAAITSIVFTAGSSGNFVANSTFSLYGLAALGTTPVIAPKASGGNIDNDGTYWYHTFLTTGAFVPATGLTCDVLVIAGGGGGGSRFGGGGGAGGLLAFTSQSLTTTSYTCTVGAGGAGGAASTSGANDGAQGSNSVFGALTAAVGGGYGSKGNSSGTLTGGTGGSGGGAGSNTTTVSNGGSATSGQGNAGGNSAADASSPSGGGGGAGAVGSNATASTPGNGGSGVNTYSSWATATSTGVSGYYAGGGGGARYTSTTSGSGGAGGAGAGGTSGATNPWAGTAGTAGTSNTGSGGGGGAQSGVDTSPSYQALAGGNGGSGIIIIRYSIA